MVASPLYVRCSGPSAAAAAAAASKPGATKSQSCCSTSTSSVVTCVSAAFTARPKPWCDGSPKHCHLPSTYLAVRRAIAHAPDERRIGLYSLPREPSPFILAGLSVGKLVAVAGDDQVAALDRAGAE